MVVEAIYFSTTTTLLLLRSLIFATVKFWDGDEIDTASHDEWAKISRLSTMGGVGGETPGGRIFRPPTSPRDVVR